MGSRFEERNVGRGIIQVIEWRTIEKVPKLEINKLGEIRTIRSSKKRPVSDGRNQRIRVMEDGFRVAYDIADLRNQAFPEEEPW
jgi:hypothetical protein